MGSAILSLSAIILGTWAASGGIGWLVWIIAYKRGRDG